MPTATDVPHAPPQIPPQMFRPICNAIGDQTNFQNLDDIIYLTFSDHKINDWASDRDPRRQIACACVRGVELEGKTVPFLAHILQRIPADSNLYRLIVDAVPATRTAFSDLEREIPKLLDALESTRGRISDPDTRKALKESQGALEDLQRRITRLDSYKHLHDVLHRIQIGSFKALRSSVQAVEDDAHAQSVGLREYQYQLQSEVVSAEDAARELPDDGKCREDTWVHKLAEVVECYGQALDRHDSVRGRFAVINLSKLLRFQSPRLNEAIVEEARMLPLNALRSALGRVPGSDPKIKNAIDTLNSVENTLVSQVAEHSLWQTLDDNI